MIQIALAAALSAATAADTVPPGPVYDGGRGEIRVSVPRVEDPEVRVDGRLDEPAWTRAARLTGFTQFKPAEGIPASESTDVLVFYTPRDLHIGIRARAADPARIRSTLAERDQITADDHVRIFLDTFLDRRRAFAFFVNPLGIQQDGTFSDAGWGGVDFAPDFIFESRGRLTADGYEVELRIPLKSLKFPSTGEQRWGLQVVRVIAATGAEESWAPRGRNEAAELSRAGVLEGIRDLRPGTLVEFNPTLTARRDGGLGPDGFRRGPLEPDVGLNLKYGLTSELTLDATVNPDFSQVEADADQITVNERFALSVREKRPFFLEGAELFSTPEPLVYTRAIVSPLAGARVTGKVGGIGVAYLGAVDDHPRRTPSVFAPRAERAGFQILRLRRDLGSTGSSLGALGTVREAGEAFNRVGAADLRLLRGAYVVGGQLGGSWTRAWVPDAAGTDSAGPPLARQPVSARTESGHIGSVFVDRTGRRWGFLVNFRDVSDGFRTGTGFVHRHGITEAGGGNRLSWYGRPGGRIERVNLRNGFRRIHEGRAFWEGGAAVEGNLVGQVEVEVRGNHQVALELARAFFTVDASDYAGYSTGARTGDALVRSGRMSGLDGASVSVSSARWSRLTLGARAGSYGTPIFAEGVRGRETGLEVEANLRPTDALRIDASLRRWVYTRDHDRSRYSSAVVPRLRLEYQVSRAVALRALAQYAVEEVDVLRAPDGRPYLRDGAPFRLRRGALQDPDAPQLNPVRVDLLFSYRPSPGTLVFLGYGREASDAEAFRFRSLEPRSDGVFFKVSYLFRR
jgi:hypothetical protein